MRKKKQNTGKGVIYSRYILPLFADVIIIISMFIPCVNYVLDNDAKDKMSISALLNNSWTTSRQYLFSSQSTPTPEGTVFYRAVFLTIIITTLLLMLAIAVDVFGLVAIIKEDNSNSPSKARILYSTLIPNRFVLCLLRLPIFPILLFPNIVALLYQKILLYPVTVNYNLLYPWILAVVLFAIQVVLLAVSKKFERRLSLDLLSKNILSKSDKTSDDIGEDYDYEAESKIYTMGTNDRNESIRQMFKNNKSDKE